MNSNSSYFRVIHASKNIVKLFTFLKPSNTQLVKNRKTTDFGPITWTLSGFLIQGLRIQKLKILIFLQCTLMLIIHSQGENQPSKIQQ
jgi:hypothetical protein